MKPGPWQCVEEVIKTQTVACGHREFGRPWAEVFGEGVGLEKVMGLQSAKSRQTRKLQAKPSRLPCGKGLSHRVIHVTREHDFLAVSDGRFGQKKWLIDRGFYHHHLRGRALRRSLAIDR